MYICMYASIHIYIYVNDDDNNNDNTNNNNNKMCVITSWPFRMGGK